MAKSDSGVLGGQLLVAVSWLITGATLPLLDPGPRGWAVFAALSTVMVVLLISSASLSWDQVPRRWILVFPASVAGGVAVLGVAAHGVGMSYTGLLVLCFAYLGLTQRPGMSSLCTSVGTGCWIAANGGWTTRLTPRLIIAVLIWVLLGEVLAQLVLKQSRLEERLLLSAHQDPLTGVANRRGLNTQLATVAPGDTVIMCDLDHFKQLNDAAGHSRGDQALADFGAALRASVRESDFPSRYGGEEFALVLPATDHAGAHVVLQRLRTHWSILQPNLTFSAGIATCTYEDNGASTIAAADTALYEAKTAGRGRDHYRIPTGTHD